jgi:hypothetical protein
MKKILSIILVYGMMITILAACGDVTEQEDVLYLPAEQPAVEIDVPNEELVVEETLEQEASLLLSDIMGYWILAHATNEAGEMVYVVYSDWLAHAIEIRDDYTFTWFAYGSISGDLVYIGENSFVATNLVASSEGEIWLPEGDEITISYDAESGLLRYTRVFNDPHGPTADTQHQLFERADGSPFPEESALLLSSVQVNFENEYLLSWFDNFHMFDYSQLSGFESDFGAYIVLWSNFQMMDFSIISLTNDFTDEGIVITAVDSWLVAGEVLPGEAIVLESYIGSGSLPTSGFSFEDEHGETRFFTFFENMGYPYEPGPYRWLVQEFDVHTGQIISLMASALVE